MPKLDTPVARPKSSAGRRSESLDETFVKALATAIQKVPVVDGRPAMHGSSEISFPTKGKAGNNGRRYAIAIQELTGWEKVSVTIIEYAKDSFGWKLYLPMSAATETVTSE